MWSTCMASRPRADTRLRGLPPELVQAIMNRTNARTRARARVASKALHPVVPRESKLSEIHDSWQVAKSDPFYDALLAVNQGNGKEDPRARVAADERIRRLAESGAKVSPYVISRYIARGYHALLPERFKTTLRILMKAAGMKPNPKTGKYPLLKVPKTELHSYIRYARNANDVKLLASAGVPVGAPQILMVANTMHAIRHAMNIDKNTYPPADYVDAIATRMRERTGHWRTGMEADVHRPTLMRLLDKAGPRGYAKMLALTNKPNDNALVRKLKRSLEFDPNGRAAATAELPHAATARAVGHLLDAGADPWRIVAGKPAIVGFLGKPGMNAHVQRALAMPAAKRHIANMLTLDEVPDAYRAAFLAHAPANWYPPYAHVRRKYMRVVDEPRLKAWLARGARVNEGLLGETPLNDAVVDAAKGLPGSARRLQLLLRHLGRDDPGLIAQLVAVAIRAAPENETPAAKAALGRTLHILMAEPLEASPLSAAIASTVNGSRPRTTQALGWRQRRAVRMAAHILNFNTLFDRDPFPLPSRFTEYGKKRHARYLNDEAYASNNGERRNWRGD